MRLDGYLVKDKECRNCKSNDRNKPDLILKINICGHSLCDGCVNLIFRHEEALCPIEGCGLRLKKAKFRDRKFEDEILDKEMNFRKLVERVYNQQESNFSNPEDYGNYLEEKEEKIYKLTYDSTETMKSILKEIEEHQKENFKTISKNNKEISAKLKEWKYEVEKQKQFDEFIANKHREEDQARLQKQNVSKHDTDLINKIAQQAQQDVAQIVKSHQEQQQAEKARLEAEERLKLEELKLENEEKENESANQRRGNARGFLNRKRFDAEMQTRKVEEPWEYRYSSSAWLPRGKDGCPRLRTREDVIGAGYSSLIL